MLLLAKPFCVSHKFTARVRANVAQKLNRSCASSKDKNPSGSSRFWKWTTQERPHWKTSMKEATIICTVFAVTGTSSMLLVRPGLKHTLGIEGSLVNGPNSYRVLSIVLISPVYATLLLFFGTLSGRHNYFSKMTVKIWSRFFGKARVERAIRKVCRIK